MSASRERKQRQGSGPSERDVQAQQKAAAYKSKVRRYTVIGVVIAVLVVALLVWNSGIFQRNQTAATVNGTNYSVNDVSYFYQNARYSQFMYYYYFGMSAPSDDTVIDTETGKTYRDSFLESALESMKQVTALYDAAVKEGYTDGSVANDVADQIASAKAAASSSGYSYGAYLKAQYGRYMTPGAFKSIVTKVAIASAYSSDYSDSLTYTDADLEAYYNENKNSLDTFEYSYLYFTPETVATTDADGNDLGLSDDEKAALEAEALDAAKANAEAALDALNDGASIESLIEEYKLGTNNSADHTSNVGSSISSSAFSEKLFAMKDGDTAIVENGESGFYVVALHERKLSQDPTADFRHILIRAETTTDDDDNTVAPTDEAWAAAQEKADSILAEYQAGEQTEDAFNALIAKYSEDVDSDGNPNNDGLYTKVAKNSSYSAEILDWLFGTTHSAGDTGIVKHEGDTSSSSAYWGYHVMYYVGENTPVWKQTADSALRNADVSEWTEGLEEGYEGSYTDAVKNVG